MNLTGVKRDDIVRCDVRGQRFFALVSKEVHDDKVRGRGIRVRSTVGGRSLPTEFIKAREVVGLWRRSKSTTVEL